MQDTVRRVETMEIKRVEELRKWITTICTVVTAVLVPVLGYAFRMSQVNQRLEMEKSAADIYVNKVMFNEEKAEHQRTDQDMWKKLTEISADVRSISNEQVRQQDGIAGLKEGLNSLRDAVQKTKL